MRAHLGLFCVLFVVGAACGGGTDASPDLAPAMFPDPTRVAPAGRLAVAREQHTASKLPGGDVLIVGGEDESFAQLSSVEVYRFGRNTFEALADLPGARSNHTATVLGSGKVLVTGGGRANEVVVPSGLEVRSDALLFDPVTGTWSPAHPMSTPRHFHTATLLQDGRVLVVGGADDHASMGAVLGGNGQASYGRAVASAEVYDPESDSWRSVGSLVQARFLHQAVLLADGRVVVAGGATDVGEVSFSSVEVFDPTTEAFTAGPAMNGDPRVFHRATRLGSGRVLVAAGKKSNTRFLADAQVATPAGDAWTSVGDLAASCTAPALVTLTSGNAVLSGGNHCASSGCQSLATVVLFDDRASAWVPIGALSTARTLHTQTVLDDGSVLVVGGWGGQAVLTEAERLVP